jgi:hypothetical protein
MPRLVSRVLLWAPVVILLSHPAAAQLLPLGRPQSVTASTGAFEVRKTLDEYEAGWELRFAPQRFRLMPRWMPDLIPVTGLMATSRGAFLAYGGVRAELPLGERWVASGGWAPALYYRGTGAGKDLGGVLEFRSHVELAYRLADEARVGLCFYHLSNGMLFSFHDFNPGTESLVITYTTRVGN